jgi:hypothetical protein
VLGLRIWFWLSHTSDGGVHADFLACRAGLLCLDLATVVATSARRRLRCWASLACLLGASANHCIALRMKIPTRSQPRCHGSIHTCLQGYSVLSKPGTVSMHHMYMAIHHICTSIVPYTFATTQMGPNSGSCSISTSASPDLLDSVNLHIFGKHSSPVLWWYQSFFRIFWLSSSFAGPEREFLGRCHPSPDSLLVRA